MLPARRRASTSRSCSTKARRSRDEFNGLRTVFAEQPDLLDGDFAVLLEPTGGAVEAGCQGSLHLPTRTSTASAPTPPVRGRDATRSTAAAAALARIAAHESDTVGVDGLGVPRVAASRARRGWRRQQRGARRVFDRGEPSLRAVLLGRRGARPRWRRCSTGADHIDVLNASPAAPPNLADPLVAAFVQSADAPGASQAGMDRRGPFRGARRAGGQLRPRRPGRVTYGGGVREPCVSRAVSRGAGTLPRTRALSIQGMTMRPASSTVNARTTSQRLPSGSAKYPE